MKHRIHGTSIRMLPAGVALLLFLTAGSLAAQAARADVFLPVVASIKPNRGTNDIGTAVEITGSGFVDPLTVEGNPPILAALGETLLQDVTWVNENTLRAIVPWGLSPGSYPLIITNPEGDEGSLSDAFTVGQGLGVWATGGPYGGQIRGIVQRPGTPATLYALSQWAGVFVTEDSGATWEPILHLDWPTSLAFDAIDRDILYVASRGNIYQSTNAGYSWVAYPWVFNPVGGSLRTVVAAHPTEAGKLYQAAGGMPNMPLQPNEGGVYYSDDFGASWSNRSTGITDLSLVDIAIHPTQPALLLAASSAGKLYFSDNAGLTWTLKHDFSEPLRRVFFNPFVSGQTWVLPEIPYQPASVPYVFRSTNLTTWDKLSPTTATSPYGGVHTLTFTAAGIFAGGDAGYFSSTNGASWTGVIPDSAPISAVSQFAIDPGNANLLYAADLEFGVVKSTNGGAAWDSINQGLAALTLREVTAVPGKPQHVFVWAYERGLLRSENGGQSWLELGIVRHGAPRGQLFAIDAEIPERVFFATYCAGAQPCVLRSENSGDSWIPSPLNLPAVHPDWDGEVANLVAHPTTTGTLYAAADIFPDAGTWFRIEDPYEVVIYNSTNYGESWNTLSVPAGMSEVRDMAFDSHDPDLIYAATQTTGLWRTTNGGETWAPLIISGAPDPVRAESLVTHPAGPGVVLVRLLNFSLSNNPDPELYLSVDGGDTWTLVNEPGVRGFELLISPPVTGTPPYTLYSGCWAGLCASDYLAETWETIPGSPEVVSLSAASDGEQHIVYVGSHGGLAAAVGASTLDLISDIPGRGAALGAGVYRLAARTPNRWVYLPVIKK